MTDFDRTNTGTLGKNKNPQSEKSPPYTGQINIEGVEYWVSGWVKQNKQTKESFFSLSVKPKQQPYSWSGSSTQASSQQAQQGTGQPYQHGSQPSVNSTVPPGQTPTYPEFDDSDIPF